MEKPWMPGLLDMLQPPPKREPVSSESDERDEPVSDHPVPSAPLSDSFADAAESHPWTLRAKQTVSERPATSAPLSESVPSGMNAEWASTRKSPLEYEASTYWNESWSDRILAHAPAITVVVLLAVALGALSFYYRVQVGQTLVRFGEELSGQAAMQQSSATVPNANASAVQPALPPTQSAAPQQPASPSPNPSTANSASGAAASATEAASTAPNADVATKSPVVAPKASEASPSESSNDQTASGSRSALTQFAAAAKPTSGSSAGAGQAEFQIADASLQQARTPADKARAAGLLWTAVSAGSSDAEVELADVYGRGQGVRKNCQQARILLAAAQDKKNPLAAKESAELRVYGCR